MSDQPSEGDIQTFYAAAHHDLWWAKGQLWTATNWLLALLAVIVSLGVLLYADPLTLSNTWLLVVLAGCLTIATSAYLSRLHYDIVRARKDAEFLRSQRPTLQALYNALPKRRQNAADPYRGVPFVAALMGVGALGLGVSFYALSHDIWPAVAAALGELVIAFISLFVAITKGAA